MADVTQEAITRERIWAALGLTPEQAEAIEQSPEFQAYERAKAEAAAAHEEFLEYVRQLAARVAADMNAKVAEQAGVEAEVRFDA